MMNLAISPHDPRIVLNSTDMTGCFLSQDGGQNWRQFNLRFTCRFAFDPRDKNVIYAAAGPSGLYRSEDGGRGWTLILPEASSMAQLRHEHDEGAGYLFDARGSLLDGVSAVAVDPVDSRRIFAAQGNSLAASDNGGKTWRRLTAMGAPARNLWIDPASPRASRAVYAALETEVGLWENGQWQRFAPPAPGASITNVALAFTGNGTPPLLWAAVESVEDGLFVSRDGGRAWSRPANLFARRFRAVAIAPSNPSIVLTSFSAQPPAIPAGDASFGVARSDDGGTTWKPVWLDHGNVAASNVSDPWLNRRFGPDWGENPLSLTVDHADPGVVFSTDLGRTVVTRNGGRTWDGVYAHRWEDGTVSSTGLDVLSCYGVHRDPFENRKIFASCTDVGLLRSENGGESWIDSLEGCPRKWRNTSYWVEHDPEVRGRMWSAQSQVHDLPRTKMLRNKSIDRLGAGGVVRSEDGGLNWTAAASGLPDAPVTHLLLDPASRPEARVLHAAVFGHGVWRTADGGRNWRPWNEGLNAGPRAAWRLSRARDGTIFLVVSQRGPQFRSPNDEGALYRRRPGDAAWEKVPLPPQVKGPTDLAADPADPLRLYLTAWGWTPLDDLDRMRGGGLWGSTDGGRSWHNLLAADQHLYSVTIDPRHPRRLHAAGYEASLWRSDDDGRSWARLPGFNFKHAHRVFPDPVQERILVTTYGSSIWAGPAQGSGGPLDEDILGPPAVVFRRPAAGSPSR